MSFFANYAAPSLIILICLSTVLLMVLKRQRNSNKSAPEDEAESGETWEPSWIKGWETNRQDPL